MHHSSFGGHQSHSSASVAAHKIGLFLGEGRYSLSVLVFAPVETGQVRRYNYLRKQVNLHCPVHAGSELIKSIELDLRLLWNYTFIEKSIL